MSGLRGIAPSVALTAALCCLSGCADPHAMPEDLADVALRQRRFVGQTIRVVVDGRETVRIEGAERAVWDAGQVGSTPRVSFSVDPDTFGMPVTGVKLTLCPVESGRAVETTTYSPSTNLTLDGSEVVLRDFRRVGLDGVETVPSLEPGTYQMTIRVTGSRGWDQQVIRMRVGEP